MSNGGYAKMFFIIQSHNHIVLKQDFRDVTLMNSIASLTFKKVSKQDTSAYSKSIILIITKVL